MISAKKFEKPLLYYSIGRCCIVSSEIDLSLNVQNYGQKFENSTFFSKTSIFREFEIKIYFCTQYHRLILKMYIFNLSVYKHLV